MNKLKTRLWIFFVTLLAFFVPFGAIIAMEKAKQADKLAQAQEEYVAMNKAADQTRAQYLQEVEKRKNDLKQAMDDAKAKYDELLKNQPSLVAQHQKQISQTTTAPIVTKQIAQASTKSSTKSSSSSSSSPAPSAPKASTPASKATTTTKTS